MDFKIFFMGLSVSERDDFAKRVGSTRGHLTNVAYGKSCAESLAINIERESGGLVRCESLRGDVDWAYLRNTGAQPPSAMHGVSHGSTEN